jgi:hypothetical protein
MITEMPKTDPGVSMEGYTPVAERVGMFYERYRPAAS